jgi:hypothetical protein
VGKDRYNNVLCRPRSGLEEPVALGSTKIVVVTGLGCLRLRELPVGLQIVFIIHSFVFLPPVLMETFFSALRTCIADL